MNVTNLSKLPIKNSFALETRFFPPFWELVRNVEPLFDKPSLLSG
jgi:hypothetical protein